MYSHAFDDHAQLLAFLSGLGLQAQVLNQLDEAPDIVSMDALNLPRRILERARPRLHLWMLTLDHAASR